jgi:hypothetical protein
VIICESESNYCIGKMDTEHHRYRLLWYTFIKYPFEDGPLAKGFDHLSCKEAITSPPLPQYLKSLAPSSARLNMLQRKAKARLSDPIRKQASKHSGHAPESLLCAERLRDSVESLRDWARPRPLGRWPDCTYKPDELGRARFIQQAQHVAYQNKSKI